MPTRPCPKYDSRYNRESDTGQHRHGHSHTHNARPSIPSHRWRLNSDPVPTTNIPPRYPTIHHDRQSANVLARRTRRSCSCSSGCCCCCCCCWNSTWQTCIDRYGDVITVMMMMIDDDSIFFCGFVCEDRTHPRARWWTSHTHANTSDFFFLSNITLTSLTFMPMASLRRLSCKTQNTIADEKTRPADIPRAASLRSISPFSTNTTIDITSCFMDIFYGNRYVPVPGMC